MTGPFPAISARYEDSSLTAKNSIFTAVGNYEDGRLLVSFLMFSGRPLNDAGHRLIDTPSSTRQLRGQSVSFVVRDVGDEPYSMRSPLLRLCTYFCFLAGFDPGFMLWRVFVIVVLYRQLLPSGQEARCVLK